MCTASNSEIYDQFEVWVPRLLWYDFVAKISGNFNRHSKAFYENLMSEVKCDVHKNNWYDVTFAIVYNIDEIQKYTTFYTIF